MVHFRQPGFVRIRCFQPQPHHQVPVLSTPSPSVSAVYQTTSNGCSSVRSRAALDRIRRKELCMAGWVRTTGERFIPPPCHTCAGLQYHNHGKGHAGPVREECILQTLHLFLLLKTPLLSRPGMYQPRHMQHCSGIFRQSPENRPAAAEPASSAHMPNDMNL